MHDATLPTPLSLGIVVIGRNEGDRVLRCIRSVGAAGSVPVVYVDSGSTDGSVERLRALSRSSRCAALSASSEVRPGGQPAKAPAPSLAREGTASPMPSAPASGGRSGDDERSPRKSSDGGSMSGVAAVVELAPPFSAARARNVGFAKLRELRPDVDVVQFLDGDTELVDGWLARGLAELRLRSDVAAVCGRRRERWPDASVYNRLCDIEWHTPVGDTRAFGGDVMIRAADFERVGGYDESLIAGEDPELALRITRGGARKIARVDHDMTLHDAALSTFGQWWKRALRGGHAYAEGAHKHRAERFWSREVRSNWTWGAALPAFAVGALLPTLGGSVVIAGAGYGALVTKVAVGARARGLSLTDAATYATFTAIAKVPQAIGQAKYWWNRARRRRHELIEYK